MAAEDRRGAPRVEFPEQELDRVDGRWALRFDPRLPSEDDNAGMSLATNLAVADAMLAAGTGLFRVMDEPSERAVARLRRTAQAFGLTWPAETSLAEFQRSLSTHDPRAAAFLIAVRRAGGGASYAAYVRGGDRPWHAAMAATYAHATAPLRRLADRYVVEATLAIANGRPVPEDVAAAFAALPSTMASCEQRANTVDRAVIDLAEAVLLAGREGEVFDAVVVDEDRHGPLVQLVEPAVMAQVVGPPRRSRRRGPRAPGGCRPRGPQDRVLPRRLSGRAEDLPLAVTESTLSSRSAAGCLLSRHGGSLDGR